MKIYNLMVYQSAFDVYPIRYKRYKYKTVAMRNFNLYAGSGKYEKIDLFVCDSEIPNYRLIAVYNKPQEVKQ